MSRELACSTFSCHLLVKLYSQINVCTSFISRSIELIEAVFLIHLYTISYTLLSYWGIRSAVLLQDIIRDDEMKLDWFFKASLIHDIVKVKK